MSASHGQLALCAGCGLYGGLPLPDVLIQLARPAFWAELARSARGWAREKDDLLTAPLAMQVQLREREIGLEAMPLSMGQGTPQRRVLFKAEAVNVGDVQKLQFLETVQRVEPPVLWPDAHQGQRFQRGGLAQRLEGFHLQAAA